MEQGWEGGEVFLEGCLGFGEGFEARVVAEFGDGAGDADGAELLEDVSVADDGGFDGEWLVVGLVSADDFEYGGDFFFGEAELGEERGGFFGDVGYVVPGFERSFEFGAVADEDAEVV